MTGRTQTIVVIAADLSNPMMTPVLHGVASRVSIEGIVPIIAESHDDSGILAELIDHMISRRVDAISGRTSTRERRLWHRTGKRCEAQAGDHTNSQYLVAGSVFISRRHDVNGLSSPVLQLAMASSGEICARCDGTCKRRGEPGRGRAGLWLGHAARVAAIRSCSWQCARSGSQRKRPRGVLLHRAALACCPS